MSINLVHFIEVVCHLINILVILINVFSMFVKKNISTSNCSVFRVHWNTQYAIQYYHHSIVLSFYNIGLDSSYSISIHHRKLYAMKLKLHFFCIKKAKPKKIVNKLIWITNISCSLQWKIKQKFSYHDYSEAQWGYKNYKGKTITSCSFRWQKKSGQNIRTYTYLFIGSFTALSRHNIIVQFR